MKPIHAWLAAAAGALAAGPAAAQALEPQSRTVVTPVATPGYLIAEVGDGDLLVTPVPGIAAATRVKVQSFSDYDRNGDGAYNPMEFAQALYFLATSDPVAGNPRLPPADRFSHRGAPEQLRPGNAIDLLNATSDEFAIVDMNDDHRISSAELAVFAMI